MIHGRTIYWGCVQQCIMNTESVDSQGQQFLDLLDQASWCHVAQPDLHGCTGVAWDVTDFGARAFF